MFFPEIKFLLIIFLFNFLIFPECYAQEKVGHLSAQDSLIGKWETPSNPLATSTLTMEFHKDKKYSFLLSSTWKGKYNLQGTKLITSYFIPTINKYKSDTSTVLIYGNSLVQIYSKNGHDSTVKMVRKEIKKIKGAGLVGTWSFNYLDNNPSIIEYKKDGQFEIHNVLRSFSGTFTVKDNKITAYSNGREMFSDKFLFIRGLLYIYNSSGTPLKLQKVE
jgi:hypothetical protein